MARPDPLPRQAAAATYGHAIAPTGSNRELTNIGSFDKANRNSSIFLGLFLLALVVRMGLLLFTIDVPGDGPTRATKAYQMFLYPTFLTHGDWLPAYDYFNSVFFYILANPALTPRIVNIILGALTVSLFYLLIGKTFDHATALMTASVLIFLPLDIGLNASSLTEPSFLFEIVAGSLMLIHSVNARQARSLYLVLTIIFLSLAVMTRYEGWALVPVFVAYYYLGTRSVLRSLALAIALLIYPAIWTIGNAYYSGDPFLGFTSGAGWTQGATPVNRLEAISIVTSSCIRHVGWILPFTAVVGLAMQGLEFVRRRFTLERCFYCAVTFVSAASLYHLAAVRGTSLWDRFLLTDLVLMLPFAVLPFSWPISLRKDEWGVAVVALLLSASVAYRPHLYENLKFRYNDLYVTLWRPTDIINVASWAKASPYRDDVIMLTENDGQSWFFPTYFPAKAFQHCVVTWYSEDSFITDYCFNIGKYQHLGDNYLLITSDKDLEVQRRVEKLGRGTIGKNNLVHTEGTLRVYDVSALMKIREASSNDKAR
jgi:Dolichyl-phosphate-mannose-protein mannosyltransferase